VGGGATRRAIQIEPGEVAASAPPIAAMNRCLMNTQSSGCFCVGADSMIFATIIHGPPSSLVRANTVRSSSIYYVCVTQRDTHYGCVTRI
jgi:hypothetical protein